MSDSRYPKPQSPKKMSKEQTLSSTETFEVLEYNGQRDLNPNQVDCFLTKPIEVRKGVQDESCDKLLCQICKEGFEGLTARHRLLEHTNSIHSFNIYDRGDSCQDCNAVFYTLRALKIHKSTCERISENSISNTSQPHENTVEMDRLKHKENKIHLENTQSDATPNPEDDKGTKQENAFDEAVQLESKKCIDEFNTVALTMKESSAVRKGLLKNSFKCYICSKVFRRTRDFRSHITSSHRNELDETDFDDLSYRCKKCANTFPNIILLREHFFEKHTALIIYRCNTCHVTLKTKKSLRIHYNHFHAHKKKELHSCGECGKELTNIKALKAHIRLKHHQNISKQGFRCRLCQQKFDSKESRKHHYEKEHQGESPFICTDCGKGFSSKSGLYGHRQLHKSDQPSTCPYCEKIFNRKDSYHEHILIHIGPRHRCPHCPKEFVQRSNLVRHIRIHTGQKPYTCTFCDKRFSDKGACNSHIRVHTKEEQCTCPYCGQTFTKKQKLKYHIRKHTGEGLLSCEICSKTFTNAFALKEHRAIHDRQTQTICVECGKAFNSAKYLQRHVTLVHPHPEDSSIAILCPICGKAFCHQTRLKSHLITHLGKKHLQCLICEKRYSSVKSIRNHLKQSHNLTPDQPEFKKCIRSTFGGTQISVNSLQLAGDSRSFEVGSQNAALTFLFKEERGAVASRAMEESVENKTILDQVRSNEDAGIKWTSKSYNKGSITCSSSDGELISADKEDKKMSVDIEIMGEIGSRDSTKFEEPQEARDTNSSINISLDSKINGHVNKVLYYENGINEEPLRIKTEIIMNYNQNHKADCEPTMKLAAANETNQFSPKINEQILNNPYKRSTHAVVTNFEKNPIILGNIEQRLSPKQLESNLSAIIKDRTKVNDESNGCDSRNNSTRKFIPASEESDYFQASEKKSRLILESSREISRRRKQLRTPKKYVSSIDMLETVDNELKNVIPKRERVEAIAQSLKESSNFKDIFIKEKN